MVLTLRVFPAPGALQVPGGVGRGFQCARVPLSLRNCRGIRSVRCSVDDSVSESVVLEEKKDVAVHSESSSSLHLDAHEVAVGEKFGGWYGDEVKIDKNTWKLAAMQVATGFLLALGVSLSYYVWCQRQGRRVIPTPPTLTQIQLPSFLKRSPHETEHSDHEEDVDEESEEDSLRNSFGKQSEKILQPDKAKVVESENVEDVRNNEEQSVLGEKEILSNESDDEPRRTASAAAAKSFISLKDQQNASDGAKDESQVDSKSALDISKDNWGPLVAEIAPEDENSRQDSKKTQKGGNDEPQLAVSQPRKLRNLQRNKKKTSAVQGRRGKVVVPAVVDRIQEQATAVLQALKVVEEGSDARAICKRRDYARWIIASSSTLTRSPANKVYPAMYIDGVTELAFADVAPDDPDFVYIQGLAEAGLIPSNFILSNGEFGEGAYDSDSEEINFRPDSPVTRQELVSWKMALGQRSLPAIDKEALQAKSGFLDIDRIDSSLWPALSVDLDAGENSIITSAFGLTRRFQPDKAVTIGQAVIALASGESSEIFAEELARLNAVRMADEAMAADDALKAQKQKELNALFDEQLSAERLQKEQAEKLFDDWMVEFEKMKEERDTEKDVLLKNKATVESEKELLQHLREQVDKQLHTLSRREMQVSIEQDILEKLRLKFEGDEEELSKLMSEVEVEKQALMQARLWAEDEARNARTHAEALQHTRKRRTSRQDGFETFNEDNIPDRSWHNGGTKARTELENFRQRPPLQDVMDKGEDLKVNISNALIQSWQTIFRVLNGFLQRVGEFLREVRWKSQQYYHATSSSTGMLLQDSAYAVSQKTQDLQAALSEFSSGVGDGTKKFANECKGEVQKLSRRFKHE